MRLAPNQGSRAFRFLALAIGLGVTTTTACVDDATDDSGVDTDAQIAKLSLVGAGMKTSPGVAARMFRVLADHGVNIEMISTSTIRISVVVERSMLDTAIVALHAAFGLDADSDYSAPLPERT